MMTSNDLLQQLMPTVNAFAVEMTTFFGRACATTYGVMGSEAAPNRTAGLLILMACIMMGPSASSSVTDACRASRSATEN